MAVSDSQRKELTGALARVPAASWLTLPNAVTMTRIAIVPVLLLAAYRGEVRIFFLMFGLSLLTDMFDGLAARRMHLESELGAQIDSWADFVTYVSMPVCGWWLCHDIMVRELPFAIVAVASFTAPAAVGLLKFRRLPSYHTWGAKSATLSMGLSVPLMLLDITPWPFRLLMPLVALEAAEEIAMTIVLPRWHPNIPSLWHALKLRNAMRSERGGSF